MSLCSVFISPFDTKPHTTYNSIRPFNQAVQKDKQGSTKYAIPWQRPKSTSTIAALGCCTNIKQCNQQCNQQPSLLQPLKHCSTSASIVASVCPPVPPILSTVRRWKTRAAAFYSCTRRQMGGSARMGLLRSTLTSAWAVARAKPPARRASSMGLFWR